MISRKYPKNQLPCRQIYSIVFASAHFTTEFGEYFMLFTVKQTNKFLWCAFLYETFELRGVFSINFSDVFYFYCTNRERGTCMIHMLDKTFHHCFVAEIQQSRVHNRVVKLAYNYECKTRTCYERLETGC